MILNYDKNFEIVGCGEARTASLWHASDAVPSSPHPTVLYLIPARKDCHFNFVAMFNPKLSIGKFKPLPPLKKGDRGGFWPLLEISFRLFCIRA